MSILLCKETDLAICMYNVYITTLLFVLLPYNPFG